ncbi:hypothetical protein [Serratia liquefaciens]|uniref:Uncharacterized protein n=1 Tax=Serratia liquefaciens TaxID=614 RepID=A0A515CTG9_SERLI|nr:hypothetical protein [Serratia liquefaciens]QDL31464.1 hypothetical protein EGO53_06570 [Serratia liquefaciens]
MDNKLSELSKPVDICNWKMDSWRAAPCNGTEWAKGYFEGWNKYHQKVEGLAPLYSQEYVSALLAELEAKDKRIAEAEINGVEKLAAAFKSWASDCSHIDYDAQRHWATASQEALSFADDLRNGGSDDQ